MNLPTSFTTAAGKYHISEEDIIFAASADFDMEYRFADSIIALTKNKLIIAAYPYREEEEYRFGGYGSWQLRGIETPALFIYPLERVKKLEVLRQVSTGVLLAVIDGVERNLCHFLFYI